MQTADVMTREVVTLSPDHSIRHAAQLMYEKGVSGLPVVDGNDVVVGMITEGDLMRRVEPAIADAAASGWFRQSSPQGLAREFVKGHSWRVGDVMSSPVVCVLETTPLGRVAELLQTRAIRRLPVLRGGKLVGIVSRRDLLRCITEELPEHPLHGDDAIRVSVEARLRDARTALRTPPRVTVEDGVIHLWGEVGTAAERDAARVVAESVAGIAGVEDHTTIVP